MKDKQPIDELFRKGLSQQKLSPPRTTWEAIQSNVDHNNSNKKIYFFFTIAASIVLVCAATWVLMTNNSDQASKTTPAFAYGLEKRITLEEIKPERPRLHLIFVQESFTNSNPLTPQASNLSDSLVDQSILKQSDILLITLPSTEKRLTASSLSIPVASELPYHLEIELNIESNVFLGEPQGMRFNLIKSMVSMAKGVQGGKKAISEFRKSKIEFINQDLNYGSEKESEAEATFEEDSPSNE